MKIIGLHGLSGVGKDTLVTNAREKDAHIVHFKLAAALRALVYTLREFVWTPVTVGNKNYEETNGITDYLISFNEVYRPIVPDLMVRGLLSLVRRELIWWGSNANRVLLVSDVRQPNEYDCIVHTLGGQVAHLTRDTCARTPCALDNLLANDDDRPMVHLPLRENFHADNVNALEEIIHRTSDMSVSGVVWESEVAFKRGVDELLRVLYPDYSKVSRDHVTNTVIGRMNVYTNWL